MNRIRFKMYFEELYKETIEKQNERIEKLEATIARMQKKKVKKD